MLTILPYPTSGDVYQPRSDRLIIYSYADQTAAYTALKAGEIDFYSFPLMGDQYDDAVADANVVVAPTVELRMTQLDLNNNYSLAERPESVYGRSPTSYLSLTLASHRIIRYIYVALPLQIFINNCLEVFGNDYFQIKFVFKLSEHCLKLFPCIFSSVFLDTINVNFHWLDFHHLNVIKIQEPKDS